MTIDERIASELRVSAPQVDEQMAWDRIESAAPLRRRGRTIRLVSISAAALGVLVLGFILGPTLSSGPDPVADPDLRGPFLDTWATTDLDESTPTMMIQVSEADTVEIVVHDDYASVCSGAGSTMTGTGRLHDTTKIVVLTPVLTCDDGSEPEAVSGPPLEEQLQNLTFTRDPGTDTLTDSFGLVWTRGIAQDLSPDDADMGWWPQSSVNEAREAQALADAGDSDYTWQLAPDLEESVMWGDFPDQEAPEIFARFLREELGWEDYAALGGVGYGLSDFGTETIILTYTRCVPGESDPIYPDEPWVGGCVPTMDGRRYETVEITVAQPGERGSSGIWMVTSSEMVEPIEQVVPLPDAEVMTILEAFLQARIDGEGAEQYVGGGDGRARLLYATTTGAPYERFEVVSLDDPNWPDGSRRFDVRLFAEDDQTVVVQSFTLGRDGTGRWGLEPNSDIFENGKALPSLHDILGGEVTFYADDTWDGSFFGPTFETNGEPADASIFHAEGYMQVLADPLPLAGDCQEGPPPANAEALAQSILSDPDFETTAPMAMTVGGAPALQMDVVNTAGLGVCEGSLRSAVSRSSLEPGSRMRLYLVDLPGGSARILSIAINASESSFESVVEAAAPIIDSIEFHAP